MPRRSQIAASIKSRDAQDPVPILVTGRLARRANCPGPAAPAARRPPPRTGVPRRPQAHPRGGHRRPVPGHRPGTAVLRRTAELLEQSTSAWLTRTQPLWPRSTTHEPGHRSGPRSRRLRGAHRRAHLAQTPARSPAKYLAALVEWGYQPAEATWAWRLDKGRTLVGQSTSCRCVQRGSTRPATALILVVRGVTGARAGIRKVSRGSALPAPARPGRRRAAGPLRWRAVARADR